MAEKYRLQLWYSGRVQGVGFRYKVAQIAKGFETAGFVRNLDDGRVHVLAVGEKSEISAFAEEIGKVMADFIRETNSRGDFTQDKYKGFDIVL